MTFLGLNGQCWIYDLGPMTARDKWAGPKRRNSCDRPLASTRPTKAEAISWGRTAGCQSRYNRIVNMELD